MNFDDSLSWESVQGRPWAPPGDLDDYRDVHPRLFLTSDRLQAVLLPGDAIQERARRIILENALARTGILPPSDYTREEDMRRAGRGIPWLAFGYLLSGDPELLAGAKAWMAAVCAFPHWERDNSLAGGECLFGLAVGYDWLFEMLDASERIRIRNKLVLQADALAKGPPVHHDVWLANHNHVEHVGLAAAGFALYDTVPEAVGWIRQADLAFDAFFETCSDDGGSTEGHQYWAYTAESVLRYAEMARDLLGRDHYGSAWLRSVSRFILSSTLPDFGPEGSVMSYGDSHRTYMTHGPTHILFRVAAEYRDGRAQWLAREMQAREVGRGGFCTWADLLWYDPSLPALRPDETPLLAHFEDTGWVTSRSGWTEDAAMVGFRCGPMHGHRAQAFYDRQTREKWPRRHTIGGGHGHPDVNSFQIYAGGAWLAIDPEYEKPKWSRNHNTILVNGRGQLGEGQTWFDRDAVHRAAAAGSILKAEHTPAYDFAAGDAGGMYGPPLTRFVRHLLFVRPDVILIVDALEAENPSRFDWLLHTETGFSEVTRDSAFARNGDMGMDIQVLNPGGARLEVEGRALSIRIEDAPSAVIAVVLCPRGVDGVRLRAQVASFDRSLFRAVVETGRGKASVALDLDRCEVEVATPGRA